MTRCLLTLLGLVGISMTPPPTAEALWWAVVIFIACLGITLVLLDIAHLPARG